MDERIHFNICPSLSLPFSFLELSVPCCLSLSPSLSFSLCVCHFLSVCLSFFLPSILSFTLHSLQDFFKLKALDYFSHFKHIDIRHIYCTYSILEFDSLIFDSIHDGVNDGTKRGETEAGPGSR
jgi:hypothetical protein